MNNENLVSMKGPQALVLVIAVIVALLNVAVLGQLTVVPLVGVAIATLVILWPGTDAQPEP